jgi:hypothetical protein
VGRVTLERILCPAAAAIFAGLVTGTEVFCQDEPKAGKSPADEPPGDTSVLERPAECILRCSSSLSRVVRLTDYGAAIYRGEFYSIKRYRTEITMFFDRVKGKRQVKL